jgi:hypothetical protein
VEATEVRREAWPGSAESLEALLRSAEGAAVVVTGIPNRRLTHDRVLRAGLDRDTTVSAALADAATAADAGIYPGDVEALGAAAGFAVAVDWQGDGAEGLVQAAFWPSSPDEVTVALTATERAASLFEHDVPAREGGSWTNDPSQASSAWRKDFAAHVQASLLEVLPGPSRPSQVVVLDALPLLASGKVDRRALPDPGDGPAASGEYEAPATDTEARLAAIWGPVLGVERIGRGDDFFALGGHSLSAMQVLARTQIEFGVPLALRVLFDSPTLRDVGSHLDALLAVTAEASPDDEGREDFEF